MNQSNQNTHDFSFNFTLSISINGFRNIIAWIASIAALLAKATLPFLAHGHIIMPQPW